MASGSLPSDPMPSDPISSDPMPSDPMTGYSIPSDSLPSDPIPSNPIPGDSLRIDSMTSDPMPSGSLPSEPMPGQQAPSDPVAPEPGAPEAVTPEAVAPEGVTPEGVASDSAPASSSIANPIFPPSLAKDPALADSPANESLPSEPIPDPAASANVPLAENSSASDNLPVPTDSLTPADNLVSADIPVPADSPVSTDSPEPEINPFVVASDKSAIEAAELVSTEVSPASEEIAIPIAPLPQNQDPAPAQAIDLRQIADQSPPLLAPDLPALAEPSPAMQRQIPIATAAPLVAPAEPKAIKLESATAAGSNSATALPLQLINQLLRKIGATPLVSLGDMLPLLRILTLALLAGLALRLATATLGAIDDLPLVGGLLELVGLVTLLNFLARNAFKQKKRAELLARIQKLRANLLG